MRDSLPAMSEENLRLVQAWVAAINRGDLDALLELAADDIEYRSYLAVVSGREGSYHGHDGLRQYFGELDEVWDSFHVEVDEYRDLGDQVMNAGRLRARGKASGLEVQERLAWLHTFRAGTGPGRYVRHQAFPDVAAALAAADSRCPDFSPVWGEDPGHLGV